MTTPSARKGSAFEVAVVNGLRRFWPGVCRIRAGAARDFGDLGGLPGGLVAELKNEKRTDLAGWWREAETEMHNAGATRAVVIHKRRGNIDPLEQWVTMPVWMLVDLLGAELQEATG